MRHIIFWFIRLFFRLPPTYTLRLSLPSLVLINNAAKLMKRFRNCSEFLQKVFLGLMYSFSYDKFKTVSQSTHRFQAQIAFFRKRKHSLHTSAPTRPPVSRHTASRDAAHARSCRASRPDVLHKPAANEEKRYADTFKKPNGALSGRNTACTAYRCHIPTSLPK